MTVPPAWPHCPSCRCSAPVPSTFVSGVRLLPVDFDRDYTFYFANGDTHTSHVLSLLEWDPARHSYLAGRIRTYEYWLRNRRARNVREAVKMLAIARRRTIAEETARHAQVLRWRYRAHTRASGYDRSLNRKKELVLAEGGPCAYCGTPNPRTVDHILPTSRGGDHRRKNLAPACIHCNCEKNNRTPAEWREDRLRAGLPWPPPPSVEDPDAIPRHLTSRRLTGPQEVTLRMLADPHSAATSGDIHRLCLAALLRQGLVTSDYYPKITDRGRVALETGRIPR